MAGRGDEASLRAASRPWFVMAGRGDEASLRADVPAVVRHRRACPGHPRSWRREQVRGCRHKAGHDGVEGGALLTECGVRILREDGTPVSKRRHGRARRRSFASRRRPGHPRALVPRARTWMPGTRPGMTVLRAVRYLRSVASASFERMERRSANVVMAGRGDEASLRADVPAIHVLWRREQGRGCPAQGRA